MNRRQFIAASAAATATALPVLARTPKPLRLGLDNFAVRAMGWNADELVDYAATLKCDSLFITDLFAFESFTPRYLREVKRHADDKGIRLYVGSWSLCPTSVTLKKDWGTAAAHLALGVRV